MTTLYLRLAVVVDDADPMRCGVCSFLDIGWTACRAVDASLTFDADAAVFMRAPACIDATNAAIDAEIDAMRRGSIDLRCAAAELEARKVKP
jgi:hypothetical protein